jgi:hypothetical protein
MFSPAGITLLECSGRKHSVGDAQEQTLGGIYPYATLQREG